MNDQEVFLGAETLRVTGEGGTVFSGSVQTPLVRAESGHDLRYGSKQFFSLRLYYRLQEV